MNAPHLIPVAVLPADQMDELILPGNAIAAYMEEDEEDYPIVRVYEVPRSFVACVK